MFQRDLRTGTLLRLAQTGCEVKVTMSRLTCNPTERVTNWDQETRSIQ